MRRALSGKREVGEAGESVFGQKNRREDQRAERDVFSFAVAENLGDQSDHLQRGGGIDLAADRQQGFQRSSPQKRRGEKLASLGRSGFQDLQNAGV